MRVLSKGIPMNEVEKVDSPTSQAVTQPKQEAAPVDVSTDAGAAPASGQKVSKLDKVNATVLGGRLQISADVSADEIDALKDMLTKYKEILKLMN